MSELARNIPDDENEITKKLQPFAIKKENGQHTMLVVIAVLIVIQILLSGYMIVHDTVEDRREAAEQVVLLNSVESYTKNLDELTNQMLDDYKTSIYNNPQVDTTSKQVVMGTEYNFNAIMLLIKQNSRLMELIAESK